MVVRRNLGALSVGGENKHSQRRVARAGLQTHISHRRYIVYMRGIFGLVYFPCRLRPLFVISLGTETVSPFKMLEVG